MQTVGIVLNVAADQTAEFERGFREMELPIWQDFNARGVMTVCTLSRLDISTRPVKRAVQYLVVVVFPTDEGHHLHDEDPRFAAWNERAEAYQIAQPLVFGGETVVSVGA